MLPSPAELIYFHEVASELNLSRAAIKLSMSQPSLSLAIRRLEKSVGENLFIRHKKGMTLTQAGKKFLLHVKPLLQYWENTKLKTVASHRNIMGDVTIGCPATFGYFLHAPMTQLLNNYPALAIHLYLDKSTKITDSVIQSNIDIGIVSNPVSHPDLIMRKLYDSEITFFSSNNPSSAQNLNSDKLVIICDQNLPQTQFLLKKWKNKLARARILNVNDLSIIADLTLHGLGIGILSSCFANRMHQLTVVPQAPVILNKLYLISRQETKQVLSIETTIAAIMTSIKNKPIFN